MDGAGPEFCVVRLCDSLTLNGGMHACIRMEPAECVYLSHGMIMLQQQEIKKKR